MDSVLKIATFNSIPNQEYSLYGSILDTQIDMLLDRLRGLCGTLPGNGEPFEDHYVSYSFKHVAPPIVVRAVRSLLYNFLPWRFQYFGAEQAESNRTVTQRQIIDACCSVKLPKFLEEALGFQMDFEFILKGYTFARGRVKISVGRIFKVKREGNSNVPGEQVGSSHMVEVSAVAFGGNVRPIGFLTVVVHFNRRFDLDMTDEPTDKDVIAFAEQLKPIVKLERLDQRRVV